MAGNNISVDQLKELIDSGKSLYILDVREEDELVAGKIKGIKNIPMSRLSQDVGQIPKAVDIHIICAGGVRSRNISSYLAKQGYDQVFNVAGGMSAWMSKGYPVIR